MCNTVYQIISDSLEQIRANPTLENFVSVWDEADRQLCDEGSYPDCLDDLRERSHEVMASSQERELVRCGSVGSVTVRLESLNPTEDRSYTIEFPRGGKPCDEDASHLMEQFLHKANEEGMPDLFFPNDSGMRKYFTEVIASQSTKAHFAHYGYNHSVEAFRITATVRPLSKEVLEIKEGTAPALEEGWL